MASLLVNPTTPVADSRRARRDRFRGDIEGLRAVAVTSVVAFHAGVGFLSGGFVGVDVFFVLSGFLITGLLVDELARTGRISLTHFYARRVRRLLPLAALVLASTAAATQVLVPAIDRAGVAVDLAAAALGVANWRFALEATQYMADTDKSPVLHFWSLGVEEQFYVVWPLLLVALIGMSGVARRSWSVAFRRMVWVLGGVFVVSLLLSVQQTSSGAAGAYYGLHTRAWELAAGGGLALLRPVLGELTRRAATGAAWLGAALVVGSMLLMDEATPFPGIAAAVPVLGTVLLLVGGVKAGDRGVSALLSHPWPRFVGRVSYAWYLWHWPCLTLAAARWPEDAADGSATTAAHARPAVVVAALVVSFLLAVASHYLVEQPMRAAPFLAASRRRSAQWGGVFVATSLVAACGLAVSTKLAGEQPVAAVVDASTDVKGPRTPSEARASRPKDSTPCYTGYATTDVPEPQDCRIGPADGGTRTIALLGDSHAQQWLPALARAAKEKGWTVYHFAKPSCTMTDVPIFHVQAKGRYTACEQWRANVMDRVAQIDGLDAIVIGRWKDYKDIALQADGSRATPETISDLWAAGSSRTYPRLAEAAPRVVVMADTPRPPHDVPSCLSRTDEPAGCAFDRTATTHQDGALLAAERAAAPKAFRTIDLTPVICPQQSCPVVSPAGLIMYRDSNHLTDGYSESLWKLMASELTKAMA
jgi:peptidoglycan/LPS O-acetylase OafA/YrhL